MRRSGRHRGIPNLPVDRWTQEHPIHLWRYVEHLRNYAGWHLTMSTAARDSTVGLLDLMLAGPMPSQKRLRSSPPTPQMLSVLKARYEGRPAAWTTAETLLLSYPKGEVEATHWQLVVDERGIVLTVGEDRLNTVRSALADGVWDHSVGPNDRVRRQEENLWFW